MTQRYYIDPTQAGVSLAEGATVKLTDAEAHHFLHVMRGKVGDTLTLFDGCGHEAEARVLGMNRREVEVCVGSVLLAPRLLSIRLDMAVSLPKGDRSRFLIEKLTELGIASLTPLISERATAQPGGKSLDKLRRYSIEACKQSGRNRLLELHEAATIEEFQHRVLAENSPQETARFVAHPYGDSLPAGIAVSMSLGADCPLAIAIGPEGGLTENEVESMVSGGWEAITLGPRILRIETAALALASLVAVSAAE